MGSDLTFEEWVLIVAGAVAGSVIGEWLGRALFRWWNARQAEKDVAARAFERHRERD